MSGRPIPNGNRGKVGYIRPAVSPDRLAGPWPADRTKGH